MLVDDLLVLGEVNTKRLIVGNVTFDPLNVRAELLKDFVGLGGGRTQLLALKAADLRNISFNDKSS